MSELAGWESYYLIVGGAAGALIGLQFVVLTLIAERPGRIVAEAGPAFATPTIVHFTTALFLAALLRAPWVSITIPAILWGLAGFGGVAYQWIVFRQMHGQSAYLPELEDWVFHAVLPGLACVMLVAAAILAFGDPRVALFGVGAVALGLLLIGIHNAWDAVFYHVTVHRSGAEE